MSVAFYPPSYRAGGSDLTIQVSPLGLVELADEEFEVHGPRLSRYSLNWAHYLGHMHAYRREVGEPQFGMNYVRALSDYLTNFVFGRGVSFQTPHATGAIVPSLIKRVWEQDNPKEALLWEIGQQASVTGDVFVKVAYEEPFVDTIGRVHPGRCRIIPLNPANCFPEWHPHDRQRLLSFKLKYRFWTTAADGTRVVQTYVEKISEVGIEEYINDELMDARPNPLGVIPIVHIPNVAVAGSPWGLSDIGDIIPLNREFNEKAHEISDIINYHAAPLTIISGAKVSQIERGAKMMMTLPKDATIQNLQALVELQGPIAYMEMVKRAMHEMTGVPETALGQMQPISNTSGVALAIQYAPTMQRWRMKTNSLSRGFRQINELILLTLFQKEPNSIYWNQSEAMAPEPGQVDVLDPADPNTYETSVHWPDPLPTDVLVKLNEIMMKVQIGLESKVGALRDLGEEFPKEKLAEIFAEQLEETRDQGALDLQRSAIAAATALLTGMVPDGAGGVAPQEPAPQDGAGGEGPGPGRPAGPSPMLQQIAEGEMTGLVERAYGTKTAQYRNPANTSTD